MVQGDAYNLPIEITNGDDVVTPDNCSGVKITVGGIVKTSDDGVIVFDTGIQKWLYPVTQEESLQFGSKIGIQVQVKISSAIINSEIMYFKVSDGLIKEVWDE